MQLSIQYDGSAPLVADGAFIRGSDAGDWLRVLAGLEIPLESLHCFILSDRNNMTAASGLFVVWPGDPPVGWSESLAESTETLAKWSGRVHLYKKITDKLFIPADAGLIPSVLPDELSALLIWDFQFFHPVYGFAGYDRKDMIFWPAVLDIPAIDGTDWSFASPGLPALPRLSKISLAEIFGEEIFEEQKEQVNSKPIEDLTADKKNKSFLSSLRDRLYLLLLKGIFGAVHGFIKLLPSGKEGAIDVSGPINKLLTWAGARMEELEKRRAGELERLLDLFETDQDEALQYAIPLSSPYLDRGEAPPSGKLSRRDTNFNLGRLRGGGRVDGWNLDNYYNSLRNKYERAAEKALSEGDFKKAAYIYAHLMGNFAAAAKALEEGKYYQEAACIYQEHLNNPAGAAECLERGGLYQEAIALYEDMGRDEKCGDLCLQLEHDRRAREFFLLAAHRAEDKKDYKEHARILKDKLKDRDSAKEALLKGWRTERQPEFFLKEYFDMHAEEDPGRLHLQVRSAYLQNDISYNKEAFLQVVARVNEEYREEALENTCRDIAFDIVSEQAKKGNGEIVHKLRRFFPDDSLLGSDCHRFVHQIKISDRPSDPAKQQLSKDIVWKRAVAVNGKAFVFGLKGQNVVVANGNWKGQWQYFRHIGILRKDTRMVIATGNVNARLVLYLNGSVPGSTSVHLGDITVDELEIENPHWMPTGAKGIAINESGIAVFYQENMEFFIGRYDKGGSLLASHRCVFGSLPLNLQGFTEQAREMICLDGYYYLPAGLVLLRISERGEIASFGARTWIKDLQLILRGGVTYLAILTNVDCQIIGPGEFDLPKMGRYKIDDIEAVAMGITGDGMLALADQTRLIVYNLNESNAAFHAAIDEAPIAILPTNQRGRLGLIGKSGAISLIDVQPNS
jgi:hypothetical protein